MAASIKVLAFAGAREVIGASEVTIDLGGSCSALEVMDALCVRYPDLVRYRPILRIAVNGAYAEMHERVAPGDEVALIPPVAGG